MEKIVSNEQIESVINDSTDEIGVGDTVTVSNGKKGKKGKDVKVLYKDDISNDENYPIEGKPLRGW